MHPHHQQVLRSLKKTDGKGRQDTVSASKCISGSTDMAGPWRHEREQLKAKGRDRQTDRHRLDMARAGEGE